MNILIVGYGFVGKATEYLFRNCSFDIDIEDLAAPILAPKDQYDYIFLCVPTPTGEDGKLDTTIISECYEYWQDKGKVVIRSTIGPDQVDEFPNACMMPEFLREKHWKEDVDDTLLPIIVSDYSLQQTLETLFPHKAVYYVRPKETMMFKLARNSALAMKVSLANHFKDVCDSMNMDYSTIEYLLESDKVFGPTHWKVPGHDGEFGFGGKCLPKDLTHMSTLCYTKDNIMQVALEDNLIRRMKNYESD